MTMEFRVPGQAPVKDYYKLHRRNRSFYMNDVTVKHQNKPKDPVQTVKRKEVLIVLPFLGYHSKHLTKQLRSCINKSYGIFNVKIVFQNTQRIKSFFPYKDKLAPSFRSKVEYRANCWDCNDFYLGKTKRRLRDRKTEHFKDHFTVVGLVTWLVNGSEVGGDLVLIQTSLLLFCK